jgi:N-acetylglucosamine malate deacetylase 1
MSDGYKIDLLAFGPHPDDVELFCGGLLACAAARGQRTGIIDITRGERSTRGDPDTRAREAAAAAQTLGVSLRECLALPDGWLSPGAGFDLADDERSRAAPVSRVVEVLRRLRPELVLVPWERERHPDHEAASALLTRALFFAGVVRFETEPSHAPFTPRQVLYYPMRYQAAATFVVDVSAVYELKSAAIARYESQVAHRQDAPFTLVGSPLSLSSLEARDRYYGAHIGVSHGEPYITRETMGLKDPLAHFRENPFARPLLFGERA